MPLILITGFPCSGKTTLSQLIAKGLTEEPYNCQVSLITDTTFGFCPSTTPQDVSQEKMVRGNMITFAERNLSKSIVLIADASHEIKGWRYQMHCIAKALPTSHMLIHCSTPQETCLEWNLSRVGSRYSSEMISQLFRRYEFPNSFNRWDSPLLTIDPLNETLPFQKIYDYLFKSTLATPNMATVPKMITEIGYPAMLEKATNAVLSVIQQGQANGVTMIRHPSWGNKMLLLPRPLSLAEGQRLKRQFIQLNKLKPLKGGENVILASFIDYLASICT